MGSIFLQGLLLGYGAAVPLGPINVMIMNYALGSYKRAIMMGLGAMSADITYLLLIVFGLLKLLEGTLFLTLITVLGGLFLLYLAYGIYQNRHKQIKEAHLNHESYSKIYLKGFTLTFLNPYTVGFWLSVMSVAELTEAHLTLLIGLVLAISSWIIVMPFVIYKSKHLFAARILTLFSLLSSAVLAFFGVMLLYRVMTNS